MMKQFLTLFLLAVSFNSYCYDCKIISKEKEYVNSDFVFLGKITSVNDKYFEIKTLEVFKGKLFEKIRSYKSNGSIYPKKGEIWLLYSTEKGKNKFFISVCGNSRSFTKPFALSDANLPPPAPLHSPVFVNELNKKQLFRLQYSNSFKSI